MLRLSRLYGTDIYTDEAGLIGKVNDVIINLEKGEVVRLTTYPLRNITKEEAREVLRKNSVLYKNVRSARDIIIVSKRVAPTANEINEMQQATTQPVRPKVRGTIGHFAAR